MTEKHLTELGPLAVSACFSEPLDIAGCDAVRLAEQLRVMLLIRLAEEHIGDAVSAGQVRCPCHLGIGQEAVAVGVSEHLRRTDRVFGTHRSHSHYLALGGEVEPLFAEVLGRVTGCSKGMGGSMHLYAAHVGFAGSVPVVAGTIPLAAGAALAAQMDGKGDVAVAYFGDGAVEEGVVHETLNFASVFKLPLLFVCENNFFSSHLHISLRQPRNDVARFAEANAVPSATVDGNDAVAVSRAVRRLMEQARGGGGPGFLEAVTYRWRGHVGPHEDIDVGVNRSGDLPLWKQRDPVRRLFEALEAAGAMTRRQFDDMRAAVAAEVGAAWRRAEAAPFPEPAALLDLVYAR
jgi:pyruvate dehydrogenase E1 component alpha subunit